MSIWKVLGWTLGIGVGLAVVSEATSKAATKAPPFDPWLHQRVLRQLTRAARIMGAPRVPPLVAKREGVANAAADDRTVYYNPDWLRAQLASLCDDPRCQDALLLGLMAHELAHERHNHASSDLQHPHEEELVADEWAGTALGLARVSPDHFERLILRFGQACTPTHPGGETRVQRIRSAYDLALLRSAATIEGPFKPA